jgi:hypothetical protein
MNLVELDELELLKDIPILEGELEWVMRVIDSPEESVSTVIRQLSRENDSTQ